MPRISARPDPTGRPTKPSAIPKPEGIFDPVARALEAIGDRWTLVLLGQLLSGPRGFQELRQRTGIAPRVLSSRLRELVESGFVRTVSEGSRSVYALTEAGSGLEPVIQSIGRWWIERGKQVLGVDTERFTETSAQSVLEALPFMLDRDRSRDADITFEIRLQGPGGGVWTIRILEGTCTVTSGFAENADVRYTADAKTWCAVCLNLIDARDAVKAGLLSKEGGRAAMDDYFHQVPTVEPQQEKAL